MTMLDTPTLTWRYSHDPRVTDFSGVKFVVDPTEIVFDPAMPENIRDRYVNHLVDSARLEDAVLLWIASSPEAHFWSYDIPFLEDYLAWPVIRTLIRESRLALVDDTRRTYALGPAANVDEIIRSVTTPRKGNA